MQLFFGCHKHFTSLKVLISKDISHQKYFNVHHVHIIKNKLSLCCYCVCLVFALIIINIILPIVVLRWWSGRKNIKNFATSSINRMLSHDELFLKNITYTSIYCASSSLHFLRGNWPHTMHTHTQECDWYNIDLSIIIVCLVTVQRRKSKKAMKRSQAFL